MSLQQQQAEKAVEAYKKLEEQGESHGAMEKVAAEYGISTRTLQRRLKAYKHNVKVKALQLLDEGYDVYAVAKKVNRSLQTIQKWAQGDNGQRQRKVSSEGSLTYLYILKASNGVWKIGITDNLEYRHANLNKDYPYGEISVHEVFKFNTRKEAERMEYSLLTLFQDKAAGYRGFDGATEYRTLSDGDVKFITERLTAACNK